VKWVKDRSTRYWILKDKDQDLGKRSKKYEFRDFEISGFIDFEIYRKVQTGANHKISKLKIRNCQLPSLPHNFTTRLYLQFKPAHSNSFDAFVQIILR
jgi:hypothetical protein